MQAVILAAGRGQRMMPLTQSVPKPMVLFRGKPLLEHTIGVLPAQVTEIIIVVGYLKEVIQNYFGSEWNGKKIIYVEQVEQKGTGHALYLCKEYIRQNQPFMVLMADDLHSKRDVDATVGAGGNVILVKRATHSFSGGAVMVDERNMLVSVVEGTHEQGGLVNTALYVLTPDIFDFEPVAIKDGKEYGLPQTIVARIGMVPTTVVMAQDWFQISSPADVERAVTEWSV
jgi:NDP-sugar pyrophosphorylase family protein